MRGLDDKMMKVMDVRLPRGHTGPILKKMRGCFASCDNAYYSDLCGPGPDREPSPGHDNG